MTTVPAPDISRQTRIGILCAIGASVAFSVNDTAIKFLSGDYALHQVVMTRTVVGLVFMLLFILPFHGGWRALHSRHLGRQFLRGGFVVFSNLCYFLGLAALPLADTVAIFFVAPLLITALSVPLLGERVGPRRWAAVTIGLLGVVVMLRPGGAFAWAVILPLVSALAYALMHMMTRLMKGSESAVSMTFYTQITFLIASGAMGLAFGDGRLAGSSDPSLAFLFRAWIWPATADWPIFIATGLGSAIGGLLIAQAYRLCEAGLAAPFEYVAIPLSIGWGLAVFGEWPDGTAWAGIALICGSGLYVFWRETRR
ncbi:MAG: DMT family transporter [Paracoccaceae bacterium]|nr:MAG: DMT family transporter [Paracoccaceae bacterium]